MADPKNGAPGEKKIRKAREVKPKTFGKVLGDMIDQVDALDPHQRGKLLGALAAQYGSPHAPKGPNDAGM